MSSSALLQRLGGAVRRRREVQGLSRSLVAARAGLSLRFLGQLETGTGNISYLKLARVAEALDCDLVTLVEQAEAGPAPVITLLGLRGAGKSTVGPLLARRLGVRFIELDEWVEDAAGLSLAQIFELHGEGYFRRLEREALSRVLEDAGGAVVATGGGIVTDPETWALLRRRTMTVWLQATPHAHWHRVMEQGDRRPMTGRPDAMAELERLWTQRLPLYAQAGMTEDTTGNSAVEVAEALIERLGRPDVLAVTDERVRRP